MADNFFSSATQVRWACKALIEGRTITQKDQMAEAGGWRLPAIIGELRHDYDWPIENPNMYTGKPARYRLNPDCDWRTLKLPKSARSLAEITDG